MAIPASISETAVITLAGLVNRSNPIIFFTAAYLIMIAFLSMRGCWPPRKTVLPLNFWV